MNVCILSILLFSIGLIFLKELMLIKQVSQKIVIFYQFWYFLNNSFKFQPNVCNRCHNLLMISMKLSDIAILNIKGSDYRCIISLISKYKVTNPMQNAKWTEKRGTL